MSGVKEKGYNVFVLDKDGKTRGHLDYREDFEEARDSAETYARENPGRTFGVERETVEVVYTIKDCGTHMEESDG